METKEIIYLASKFAAKGTDYEKAMYSDDLHGKEDIIDDIWEYVIEYKEIGSIAFKEKYKDYNLY